MSPWALSDEALDGSISGVLGEKTPKKVEKAKAEKREELVSQTDILKDTIHIEKAQNENWRRWIV